MKKVNVIIPAIEVDTRLHRCLEGLEKQKYKNFFVTLVLDKKKNLNTLKKFNFLIKIIILQKYTMSKKRNIAVSRFSSEYIAFIDSDASPGKNWLFKSINILEKKKIHIVGGPNLPFNYKEYWKKITHYCKRSFFITAKYNFINYKSKNRITDLLHSSNFIISKKKYLSVNGMNEKLYIGEDHDFFFRLNRKFKDLKILFDKEVFVYHEDRELKFFLLQRFCYGLNICLLYTSPSPRDS